MYKLEIDSTFNINHKVYHKFHLSNHKNEEDEKLWIFRKYYGLIFFSLKKYLIILKSLKHFFGK